MSIKPIDFNLVVYFSLKRAIFNNLIMCSKNLPQNSTTASELLIVLNATASSTSLLLHGGAHFTYETVFFSNLDHL